MLKLIAVNYTVMLNGYSQWLNIKEKKQFYRDISSIDIKWCWPSIIKKMPLKKY